MTQDKRSVLDRRGMPFVWLTKAVMMDESLKASDKSVYAVLCMYADNNTSDCWPSRDSIMKKAGISDHSLRKSIRILKDAGYIEVRKRTNSRGQASNLYILLDVSDKEIK